MVCSARLLVHSARCAGSFVRRALRRVCVFVWACGRAWVPVPPRTHQAQPGGKLLKIFNPVLEDDAELKALKAEVNEFS